MLDARGEKLLLNDEGLAVTGSWATTNNVFLKITISNLIFINSILLVPTKVCHYLVKILMENDSLSLTIGFFFLFLRSFSPQKLGVVSQNFEFLPVTKYLIKI